MRTSSTLQRIGRWLFIVTLAVMIFAVACLYLRLRIHHQVEAQLAAIELAGYPTSLNDLDAWYPRPSSGKNAAEIYLTAFAKMNFDSAHHKLVPLFGEVPFPARGETMNGETHDAITSFLAENVEARMLLHEAASLKQSRYPIELKNGYSTRLPHLDLIRAASFLIALETLHHINENSPDKTAQSILASLALARSLANEPLFMSQTVRLSQEGNAVALLERSLNYLSFSETQLVVLARAFSESDNFNGLIRATAAERLLGTDAFDGITRLGEPNNILAEWNNPSDRLLLLARRITGLWQLDQRAFFDLMGTMLDALQSPHPDLPQLANTLQEKRRNLPRYCTMTRSFGPPSALVRMEAKRLARARCAIIALAVERFRLERDRWPETLDELVPDFLAAIPTDPFGGAPLRYERLSATPNSYAIFSVGETFGNNTTNTLPSDTPIQKPAAQISFIVER